jgi:ketopantoate reductase
MQEMVKIAAALGYDISDEERKVFQRVAEYTGTQIYGSMYCDAVQGKPMELEVLIYNPLRTRSHDFILTCSLCR